MERKVWTKDEFLNKYDELKRQGLDDLEIKERFDMDYMNIVNFRDLRKYFIVYSDDKNVNEIIERLKKSVDECGAMYINKKLWAPVDPMGVFEIAVAVLKNEGYEEWFICMGKSDEENKMYILLASPKIDDTDILEFIKKTKQVVDNKS